MNGEEKILAMLEQIQQGQTKIEQDLANLKDTVQAVKISQLKVELEQFPRIAAALEGASSGNRKNEEQDIRMSILENKTENHGDRILALECAFKTK